MSIELPEEVFRYQTAAEAVATEQQHHTPVESIYVEKGVWVQLKGAAFPQRGLVTPEMMAAMNISKRLLVKMLHVATMPVLLPAYAIFIVLPYVLKKRILHTVLGMYVEVAYKSVREFVVEDEHQAEFSKELEWFVYVYMKDLELKDYYAKALSEVISTVVQGDSAYRYRVMDIFHEIDGKRLYKHPTREIIRVAKLSASREYLYPYMAKKITTLGYVLGMIMLYPKARHALRVALQKIDLSKLGYNEIDNYWAMLHKDYNYKGLTYDKRLATLDGVSKPELI